MTKTTTKSSSSSGVAGLGTFESIVGYVPQSIVTSEAAIDLDLQLMEELLQGATADDFVAAAAVYVEGAFSWPYAELKIDDGLPVKLTPGIAVQSVNQYGTTVYGTVLEPAAAGSQILKVQYTPSSVQAEYVTCQVGANPRPNFDGCFQPLGKLTIAGVADQIDFHYDLEAGNKNYRTLQGFSTNAAAKMKPCPRCDYFRDFQHYAELFGTADYADQWIRAAFEGTAARYQSGMADIIADFSHFGLEARTHAIQVAAAFLSTNMFVIRELEDSFQKCQADCGKHRCTDDALDFLDSAVAFYTGSLVVTKGSQHGKLHYSLADEMCQKFRTCGLSGSSARGTSLVNHKVFTEFETMKQGILGDNCPDVRRGKDHIVEQMYVPLIQATLESAYKRDQMGDQVTQKEKALGATFAASILPAVARCHPEDAVTIFKNMHLNVKRTSFKDVKAAFERQYSCMKVTCEDVGGYYRSMLLGYYDGADPCVTPKEKGPGFPIGMTFVSFVGLGLLFYMRKKYLQRKARLAKYDEDNDLSESSHDDELIFT